MKEVCLTAETLLLEALLLVDLLLLLRLGLDVLESAGDGLWDWGRGGEVSTLGLESVLISDVGDGDRDALGGGVGEGTLGNLSLCVLDSSVLQVSLFLGCDTITSLVIVLVGAIEVDLLGLFDDGNYLALVLLLLLVLGRELWGGVCSGHEHG